MNDHKYVVDEVSRLIALHEEMQSAFTVEGIVYVRTVQSTFATDDDNALYTGIALAAAVYRWKCQPSERAEQHIRSCLDAIATLTSSTPVAGVLARRVMPLDKLTFSSFGYDKVESVKRGDYWSSRILSGQLIEYDGKAVLLKATKDQLTGVLYGLSVFMRYCKSLTLETMLAKRIIMNLHEAIRQRGWRVTDHNGDKHGSTATKLDAPLRVLLKALFHASVGGEKPYEFSFIATAYLSFHYNKHIQNAYSHQLNAMAAYSLGLMSEHHHHSKHVDHWKKVIYRVIKDENNPFWELLLTGKISNSGLARYRYRRDNPYTKFFSWNRYENELKHRYGTVGPQLDTIIVGWWNELNKASGCTCAVEAYHCPVHWKD